MPDTLPWGRRITIVVAGQMVCAYCWGRGLIPTAATTLWNLCPGCDGDGKVWMR